jgi:hypothetical protein
LADRLAKISATDPQDNIVSSLLDLLGKSIPDERASMEIIWQAIVNGSRTSSFEIELGWACNGCLWRA